MKKIFTEDRIIRGSVAMVLAGFIAAGVFRQVTRTGGSVWDAWRPVAGLLFLLPIVLILGIGIAAFIKERLALPRGKRGFDRRWFLVPLFGVLALVHLLQLFVIPMRSMEIFYHGTFVQDTARRLGIGGFVPLFYLCFIVTMFSILRNSFVIVAFYLFRAIDRIFVDVRSTVDYMLMIASPLAYFVLISLLAPHELRYEVLETATGIMLSHYLALSVCWVLVKYRRRSAMTRGAYVVTQILNGLAILPLAVTTLWFYIAYLVLETDLVWRLVFHAFLILGAYGSFRFYFKHVEELWVAKETMDAPE